MGAAVGVQTHFNMQASDNDTVDLCTEVGTDDTRFTIVLDTLYVWRVKMAVTGMAFNNQNFRLESDVDSAGYNQVTTSSGDVQLADAQPADGVSVGSELLPNDGASYFSGPYEESGDAPTETLNVGETEICFGITFPAANFSGGESVNLRVTNAGTVYDTYTEEDAVLIPAGVDELSAQGMVVGAG